MADSISSSIVTCLKAFNEFIEDIQDPDEDEPEGLHVQTWQDELGRLRIWAANIGAHQTGQSSLDFRLRDSSHIRQQIIKLLDELLQRLQDVRHVIAEGEDEDVESLGGSSSGDEEPQTEIQQLLRSIATIINCLFQMSMLVRKPAPHDLLIGSKKADVAAFEPFDYNHVIDKFPKADNRVLSRLGQANTRRRKYLKYRERHAMKLKQGINKVINTSGGDTEVLSETVATDVRSRNIDFDEKASESGFSQTSYAPTLMSGGAITIPAPPRASKDGAAFECPYCFYVINTESTRSWNRHVFNDLQPYICTEITCTIPDKLYATRHEWLQHLRTAHRCEETSQAGAGHPQVLRNCALCGDSQNSERGYDRHVARHLQELALFVLPHNDENSDEDEYTDISDSRSSLASSADNQVQERPDVSTMGDPVAEGDLGAARELEDTTDLSRESSDSDTLSIETLGLIKVSREEYKRKKEAEEVALRKLVFEEYTLKKLQEELKKEEKEEADKAFKERVWTTFAAAGYDESSIEKILEKEGKGQGQGQGQKKITDLTRPTYIKVHRKHLSPETLDTYDLPWEWYEFDYNYILIKRWIPEEDQEILFEHTRRLRQREYGLPNRQQSDVEDDDSLVSANSLDGANFDRSKPAVGHRLPSIVHDINNPRDDEYSPEPVSRRRSYSDHYNDDSWDTPTDSYERVSPRWQREIRVKRDYGSRTSSPDPEVERSLQRLAELERKEEEELARQNLEKELIIEEANRRKTKEEEEEAEEVRQKSVSEFIFEKMRRRKQKKEEEAAGQKFDQEEFGDRSRARSPDP